MHKKYAISLIVVLLITSLLFIGGGLTGFIIKEQDFEYCKVDNECLSDNVCCLFYKENVGLCDQYSKCNLIYSVSREEKSDALKSPSTGIDYGDIALKIRSAEAVDAGIVFILMGALGFALVFYLARKHL